MRVEVKIKNSGYKKLENESSNGRREWEARKEKWEFKMVIFVF